VQELGQELGNAGKKSKSMEELEKSVAELQASLAELRRKPNHRDGHRRHVSGVPLLNRQGSANSRSTPQLQQSALLLLVACVVTNNTLERKDAQHLKPLATGEPLLP